MSGMMMRVVGCVGSCLLGSIGAGCGPDTVAEAELDEVCGEPSPFRVLELEPDEQLRYARPLRVGDRVLYLISTIAAPIGSNKYPETTATKVMATGPCGESPVQLATGIQSIFTIEAWPDVVLGCEEETGDVVVLDPSGLAEPHVVFSDVPHTLGCGLRWTPHGVLSVDDHGDETGALLLHPYPADPRAETASPVVLLDPVSIKPTGRGGTSLIANSIRAYDEFVIALTPDGTVVRVELADGEVTTLATDVLALDASRGGQHVIWQDATVTEPDSNFPAGKIFYRDLSVDSASLLVEAPLELSIFPMQWADQGLIQIGLGYINKEPKRLFLLPNLASVDVDAELFLNARVDDERWIGGSMAGSDYNLIDLKKGETRRLFPRPGRVKRFDGEVLDLFEAESCCIQGSPRDEGPMWRVPIDGSPSERQATRVTQFVQFLSDGRLISPVSVDSNWQSDLVLIEPETQEELRVDARVFAASLDTSRAEDEGIVTYSVSDGERSGVYLAKLAPRERSGSIARRGEEVEAFVVDVVADGDGRLTPQVRPMNEPSDRPGGDHRAPRAP